MKYSISDYSADPAGSLKSTSALQAAIDAAAEAGGGTVIIPPGRYVIGTVRLQSNIRLSIEPGAVLAGSPDMDDYEEDDEGHIPPEFPYVRCLFTGYDLENVEITGGGTVDGSGAAFMDYSVPTFDNTFTKEALAAMPEDRRNEYVSKHERMRPTWIFFLRRCRNIRFHDFRMVDMARWTTRFSLCENIIMSGLIIENDLRAANSDGMHFTSCRNVMISDCTITSGDDCIAVTTYGDDDSTCSGVTVTNCVLTSHSAGIRIGFSPEALLEDVIVNSCIFRNCNRGVGIFAGTGARVRHITLSDLRISTRLIAGTWWGKAEPILITTLGQEAVIEDVCIADVSAQSEQGIVMHAADGSAIRDIRFSDIRLCLESGPMSPFSSGTLDLRPLLMERRLLPAVFAHGVSGLTLRDIDIVIDTPAQEYFSGLIELPECRDLNIQSLSGMQAKYKKNLDMPGETL